MNWKPDRFRLFISHVSTSHALASEIAERLDGRYGIHAFVAHADIEPSADWQNEIQDALGSANALLALLTPGFSASIWCNQEVGWALGRGYPTISLRLGEDPRGFVGRFQAIPGHDGNIIRIGKNIFGVLTKHPLSAERMGEVTSIRFRQANSWESIKDDLGPDVSQLIYITPTILDNLEAAFRDTYHVKTSRYVSSIKALLESHGRQVDTS